MHGRRVRLTSDQARYLETATYLSSELRDGLRRGVSDSAEPASFEIDSALAEQLRTAFTDRLGAAGFDESYEPNDEGKLLEGLIDAFQ
jgi:hypothetical protein